MLLHHPDRSSDPKSKALFLSATEAYEALGDAGRRKEYDDRLAIEKKLKQGRVTAPKPPAPTSRAQTPSGKLAEVKLDVNRLSTLYSRGNFAEAEKLARSVIERDRRQSVPYAVLGDIARMSGNKKEAIKMFACAVQYDPRNPVYQRRYDDLVDSTIAVAYVSTPTRAQPAEEKTNQMAAPLFGLGLIVIASVYVIVANETPVMPGIQLISTWTVGLIAMLFFSGVVLGSCMSVDGMLDRFGSMGTNAIGRPSPSVALASIAVVSFWVAAAMYAVIGWKRRAFDISTSRIVASVIAGTCMLALAAEASRGISGVQVFLWGGNLVYLGAVCGWMVTDVLRSSAV